MEPYNAPHLHELAASYPADQGAGRVVASISDHGFSTRDLEELAPANDLDWSLDPEPAPAPQHAEPEPQAARRRVGWLAPLVFLLGLALAGVGALLALLAAAVLGMVVALYLLLPGGTPASDAEFILVPDTLPAHPVPAERSDAEFILVPDTLPVQGQGVEKEAAPRPTPPARPARPPAPARPAPAAQEVPVPEARGHRAKVSLEAVPLEEAVRRVKGKAGRGEARSARGH